MVRAWEYCHNRLVCGIHYPIDIEAGRIAGTVIAQTIRTHDDDKAEYEARRKSVATCLACGTHDLRLKCAPPDAIPAASLYR